MLTGGDAVVGSLISMLIGSGLSALLHISMVDFSNLWILVLITSLMIPLPLLLLRFVPSSQ